MSKKGRRTEFKLKTQAAEEQVAENKTPVEMRPESVAQNGWTTGLYWFLTISFLVIPFGWVPGSVHPYNKAFYLLVLVATIALFWLWFAVGYRAIKLVTTPFFLGVGAWLVAKLVTTATSMLPVISFWGTYETWAEGFIYALTVAVIAGVIITLRLDTRRIVRIVHLLGLQALILSLMTVYQAIQEGFFYQKVRPDSPLLNSDFFLSYALLFLPLAVVLLFVALKSKQWSRAIPYAVGTLILSAAIFVTLPTHLQTILAPGFMNGKKDTTFGATDTKNVNISNFTETTSNIARWDEWRLGLKLGSFRPLVGTGPSTTQNAFFAKQSQLDLRGWNHDDIMDNAHNDLIEQFSQEGLLGLSAYIFFWVTLVWVVLKYRRTIEPGATPYAIGIGLGLLFWFFFNQLLFTTVFAGLIEWIWIALLISLVHAGRPTDKFLPKALVGTLAIGFVVLSIFVLHGYGDDNALFVAQSTNLKLQQGGYAYLGGAEEIAVAKTAAAQQADAADDLTYVGYYQHEAALSALNVYIFEQSGNSPDKQLQADNALRFSRQAVADDSTYPAYIQTLGGAEYYLAPAGSAQEKAGIALMNRAISLTPNSVVWYRISAQTAALKKDYPLARSFVHRGQQVAKTSNDKNILKNVAASIPSS